MKILFLATYFSQNISQIKFSIKILSINTVLPKLSFQKVKFTFKNVSFLQTDRLEI